jgi:hypothetical protein
VIDSCQVGCAKLRAADRDWPGGWLPLAHRAGNAPRRKAAAVLGIRDEAGSRDRAAGR